MDALTLTVEYCRNLVFRRNFPIHKLFERSCDIGLLRMLPDKITQIFGFRLHKKLRGKLQTVLERHLPGLEGNTAAIARAARASIKVNTALAAAAHGDYKALATAASAVLLLGPRGMFRYFRDSRIAERLVPRVRAKWSGAL